MIKSGAAVNDITLILGQIERGETSAGDRLLPLVYEELRRLASAKMARESAVQTLQPTALVHEAWLRLGGEAQPAWKNRAHFFSAAAEAMRRILIDRARKRYAQRHGGGQERFNVEDLELASPGDDNVLLAINEALEKFAVHDAQKAELVKLRYFVGLTIEKAARTLGIAEPTAKRGWAYSRAWLYRELRPD
jgi:RNA polymerase sigma factor (TIGR02999 family)